jgi:hypothetical protein
MTTISGLRADEMYLRINNYNMNKGKNLKSWYAVFVLVFLFLIPLKSTAQPSYSINITQLGGSGMANPGGLYFNPCERSVLHQRSGGTFYGRIGIDNSTGQVYIWDAYPAGSYHYTIDFYPWFLYGDYETHDLYFTVSENCAAEATGANVYNGNVVLNTQAQIQAFFNHNSGADSGKKYTKINGSLNINCYSSDPILSFCNLSQISEITGSLIIENFNFKNMPNDLSALSNLSKVGNHLLIGSNNKFASIVLPSLKNVGSSLVIKDNLYAQSVVFNNLESVKGDRLVVSNQPRATSIYFSRNAASFSFTGKGSSLDISNNGNLTSSALTMDFKKITSVKGPVRFYNNDNVGVTNLNNILTGLTSISSSWGTLTVTDNNYLASCCIVATAAVSGTRTISGNTGNCASLTALVSNCGALHKMSGTALNQDVLPIEASVYPNPSNGDLSIALNQPVTSDINIIISDVLGREVYRNSGTPNELGIITIQSMGIAPGQYIITIMTGNDILARKMLVEL